MRRLSPGGELADVLGAYESVGRSEIGSRPWVLANMVCGLDGCVAISGRVGALSNPADARLFLELRSLADVVLVGAETVRRERYGPVQLDEPLREQRTGHGRSPDPRLAVVSRSLRIDWSLPLFADSDPAQPPLLLTCSEADPSAVAEARRYAEVVIAGQSDVEMPAGLAALHERGASVVLCEGGPRLLGELVAADLLDELCLCVSPVMGGDPLPVAVVPPGAGLARFRLAHVLADDDDALFLRYERRADR